jgi:hypothetical protein
VFFEKIGKNADEISAEFYVGETSLLGFYSPLYKKIKINLAAIDLFAQINLMKKLYDNDLANINNDVGFKKLFAAAPGYTSTVIHELEHARRGTAEGVHTTGPGPDGIDYDFNACAGMWAKKAFKLGCLESWQKGVSPGGSSNLDSWLTDQQIALLKDLAAIDKNKLLTEVLGFEKEK